MAAMKYLGLVASDRDFADGLAFLESAARAAGVPLLSANLTDMSGKLLFQDRLVFQAGKEKVCAVPLSPAAGYGPGTQRLDAAAAAKRVLASLAGEGCQVKLLLANLARPDLETLLKAVPGFDLAFTAHDGWGGAPQIVNGVPVVYAGQRGRMLNRIDVLTDDGPGVFSDVGSLDRARGDLARIDVQIQEITKRMKTASGPAAANFQGQVAALTKRRAELAQEAAGTKASRTFRATSVLLDTSVADDPALEKQMDAYRAKWPDVPERPFPVPAMPVAAARMTSAGIPAVRPVPPPRPAPAH